MYVDLNLPWPTTHLNHLLQSSNASRKGKNKATQNTAQPTTPLDIWKGISTEEKNGLRQLVLCAIRLGYSVIAFNLIIPQSLDPVLLAPHFPFPSDEPPFPDLDPRTASTQNGFGKTVLQLSRLTVVMDENITRGGKGVFGFPKSQAAYLSQYSILGALPLDSGAFGHACLSLSTPSPTGIDLISFDLASSPKLPFHMQLSTVSNAIKNHTLFEAVYSPSTSRNSYAIYSTSNFPVLGSSTTCRKNLVSRIKELIRVTNCGKGLVISSAAKNWAELRSPDDVVNLFNVLGLSHEHGRKAISMNPKSIVSKAISCRQTHKGVISAPVVITTNEPSSANHQLLKRDCASDTTNNQVIGSKRIRN